MTTLDAQLTLGDVVAVARAHEPVEGLSDNLREVIKPSREWVGSVVEEIEQARKEGKKPKAYYSINTGFGAQAGKSALDSEYKTKVLSRNLIASHSVGVGECFDEETVRAAMLIRAKALTKGYSGVRDIVIETLVDMLNKRVYPAVPSKGSLGASGDLAPLSHLILMMTEPPQLGPNALGTDEAVHALLDRERDGEGFLQVRNLSELQTSAANTLHVTEDRLTGETILWQRVSGSKAMQAADLKRIVLNAKEGLALNNGATFSVAIAALTLYDALNLLENAEVALAMTLEAVRGFRDPFFPMVHEARGHPGACATAQTVLEYVTGSTMLDRGAQDEDPGRLPPQDFYSVRCSPQVLGAVRDTLEFVKGTIERELNAATDNPLIFMDPQDLRRSYRTVSCGNFHGEPIAMAMDFLGIAVTELGNIADRRMFNLMDYGFAVHTAANANGQGRHNGQADEVTTYKLEDFLVKEEEDWQGLNSGFMIAQYTAAALVSDSKTLAHPDSVDSIPSSANKEDHVSMSLNAARHAREITDNIEAVIAIELLCATQAIDLWLNQAKESGLLRLGAGTRASYDRIREEVKFLEFDRVLYPDIRALIKLIRSGELVRVARAARVLEAEV